MSQSQKDLQQEFSFVLVTALYIPSDTNAKAALDHLSLFLIPTYNQLKKKPWSLLREPLWQSLMTHPYSSRTASKGSNWVFSLNHRDLHQHCPLLHQAFCWKHIMNRKPWMPKEVQVLLSGMQHLDWRTESSACHNLKRRIKGMIEGHFYNSELICGKASSTSQTTEEISNPIQTAVPSWLRMSIVSLHTLELLRVIMEPSPHWMLSRYCCWPFRSMKWGWSSS